MLKLYSRNYLVEGRDGHRETFSFDDVRNELLNCFKQCGITDCWPAEDIILIIEEQLERRREGSNLPVAIDDINQMIASVLYAAGYSDVATLYQISCNLEPGCKIMGVPEEWSREDLQELLLDEFLLDGTEADSLAQSVEQSLQLLGFKKAGREFIRQLAAHKLHLDHPVITEHDSQPSLFDSDDYHQRELSIEDQKLFTCQALKLYPVTPALPRVRIDLDFVHLLENLEFTDATEIEVLPAVQKTVETIIQVVNRARINLGNTGRHVKQHPSFLIVRRLDKAIEKCMAPMGLAKRKRFQKELLESMKNMIEQSVDYDINFSFRNTER